ncbi:MAG: double zinc ribbon domain-containing protein [Oscillospiraceae bacterium]|jgi:ComF family protein|nr:double zinc ribbon domain-containing protein [Oscillospiraceae bacterium]
MSQALDRFLSLLFPSGCVLCGDAVAPDNYICARCRPDRVDGVLCALCGKTTGGCVCRPGNAWAFEQAVSALHYRHQTRNALLRLKKTPDMRTARFLADEMVLALRDALEGDIGFDLVTEVPIHPDKLSARGFNQAELLAAEVAKSLALPHRMRVLRCVGAAVFQHALDKKGRVDSAPERYGLAIARIKGARILLVDDIMTTGATLDACAKIRKDGGAASVLALTAAGTERNMARAV